jgi:glycerol-3-phosphate dehydrogenase
MATFERDYKALTDSQFDVTIIGGGISGAWLALHCAQSGYKTALVEESDFASQTSSSSSKLLHGGIRYLQQMQFSKVRESALERAHYIYAAPHLSTAVPFLVPTYKDFARSKFFLNCGMLAYRLLTLGENRLIDQAEERLPPKRSLSAKQLQTMLDLGDEPHTGAVLFYERHMVNSERMVLSILRSAAEKGATIVNYCRAESYIRNGKYVSGVRVVDRLTGCDYALNSRLVVNAAGPWIDDLNTSLRNGESEPSINGYAVGSHIITRQVSNQAIALTTKHQSNATIDRGGRHVFVIPWRGKSLIGTSYEEINAPQKDLLAQPAHVEELLSAVNENLPNANLTEDDVVSGYSGLYPLRTDTIKSTVYQGSGEYSIIDHADNDNVEGVITALGAKFTTGRKLSALTMARIQKKLGGDIQIGKCKLHNSNYQSFAKFQRLKIDQYCKHLPTATIEHLLQQYGTEIDDLLALTESSPELLEKISGDQPDIMAQVVWALTREQAQSIEDIIFRRTSVGLLGLSQGDVEKIAKVCADYSNWSATTLEEYKQHALIRLKQMGEALRIAHSV